RGWCWGVRWALFSCRGDETAGFFHHTPPGEAQQSLLHEGRRSSYANADPRRGWGLDLEPQPDAGAGAGADARLQNENSYQGWCEQEGVPRVSSGIVRVIPGTDSPRIAGPVPCAEHLENERRPTRWSPYTRSSFVFRRR